eukprot:CAMPEP_0115862628 /NCGR_PEP_ID=MMETSP0287-20121206/18275_1 /TAXON_ID=412157 /ORGANISM="Chrysochromulina rotalis, Strain UIO044" /LENGTH=52 /DNA_ID=CAMNT_0003317057 /DNA_START=231 /DNA_END=386 /DNA_ORIENTATION=-
MSPPWKSFAPAGLVDLTRIRIEPLDALANRSVDGDAEATAHDGDPRRRHDAR